MKDNLYARVRQHVLAALRDVVPDAPEAVIARVDVTPSREPGQGDMASNVALVAAKSARRSPAALAQALAPLLAKAPEIDHVEAAGPGFLNLRLKPKFYRDLVPIILMEGEAYGSTDLGRDARVNVEYVSANPTGPMHVGHCRGAVVGDALANLLVRAGFSATKEFYINDAGAQVNALAWAAYWRYLQAIGTATTLEEFSALAPGGLQYPGDYLVPVGTALAARHGAALSDAGRPAAPEVWFDQVRDCVVQSMMRLVHQDLELLGVWHGVFTSERALVESGATDAAIAALRDKGLIYEGVLEPPKGMLPEDWEPRPQTLFRSTAFGDDVDRPLRKSDGTNTYFANDIAYHADKIARGESLLIDVWGADHGGYVKRMQAAVRGLSDSVRLEVVLCQVVHIVRDGKPVRMSKRSGEFETLRDLIEEVGRDAVRFTMLTRKPDAQMEFDLDQAVAQTRDNPVFYVQYAHARCRSVLRTAVEAFGRPEVSAAALAMAPLGSLEAEPELAVLRRLAAWPRLLEGAALAREPHRIAFYLYDLASDFHALWNRGRDDSTLRFLQHGRPVETLARLALVAATATVIRSGLGIMGVEPVEELR